MSSKRPPPCVIAGAGWAGLAAAITLTQAGKPVIVLESARQAGGRARAINTGGLQVDNGQHLLLGAYHTLFRLLRQLKVAPEQQLLRLPLTLEYRSLAGRDFKLRAPRLPAPLHLASALALAHGLPRAQRVSALRMAARLARQRYQLRHDMSVRDLLLQHGQTDDAIRCLWEPLCLGALNTHISQASARIFLTTLRDAFHHRRRDSDLVLYRHDLSALFVQPAIDYITAHGGQVLTGHKLEQLDIEANRLHGVITNHGAILCEQLILATPHHITARLCEPHRALAPVTASLKRLSHEPICTVYLQYPDTVRLPSPLLGVLDGTSQWIFDRRLNGQPGLMAVVISASGGHSQLSPDALGALISQELAQLFPHWPAAHSIRVIREKHATFCCHVDVDQWRPDHLTNIDGLMLAGDYTRTGYPATLEGALRSGVQCAQQLLTYLRKPS